MVPIRDVPSLSSQVRSCRPQLRAISQGPSSAPSTAWQACLKATRHHSLGVGGGAAPAPFWRNFQIRFSNPPRNNKLESERTRSKEWVVCPTRIAACLPIESLFVLLSERTQGPEPAQRKLLSVASTTDLQQQGYRWIWPAGPQRSEDPSLAMLLRCESNSYRLSCLHAPVCLSYDDCSKLKLCNSLVA